MKTFLIFLLIVAGACAQSALTPPQVGFIQIERAVHPVNGLAGNFLLGHQTATGVTSAGFSGSYGMLKSDSTLMAIDGRGKTIASVETSPGSALFAFYPSGAPALAYFEHDTSLMTWNGRTFRQVPLHAITLAAKSVLAIAAPQPGMASLIVEREDGLWELRVTLATGAVVSQMALPGVKAPILALSDGALVFGNPDGLVIRRPDASEKHITAHLPKKFALQQMGDGWVELSDLTTVCFFAVRTTPGHEQFYVLPEVRQ